MAKQIIKTIFQIRRDSTENWNLYKDIIPAAGEPCYDLDRKTLRVGDGKTTYENLPVMGSSDISDDLQVAITQLQEQVGDTNVHEMSENVTQLTTDVTNLTTQVGEANTDITEIQQILENKADVENVYTKSEVYTKQEVDELYVALDPNETYVFSGGDI